MNKKIAIIGGGIFGMTIYILLKKKGIDCSLFEKKNTLLSGASTNNLNRVHFGYHYPRDNLTAKQSYRGFLSFRNLYKRTLIQNFSNHAGAEPKYKSTFFKCTQYFACLKICGLILTVKLKFNSAKYKDI